MMIMSLANDESRQSHYTITQRASKISQYFDLFDFDFGMLTPHTRDQTIGRAFGVQRGQTSDL